MLTNIGGFGILRAYKLTIRRECSIFEVLEEQRNMN